MKKRRFLYSALAVLILLFLISAGVTGYYQFADPVTAQVSIQPMVRTMSNTFTLTVVPGTPNVAQQQIAGARLLTATTQQTIVQKATGQGSAPATSASGIIKMTFVYLANYSDGTITEYAGSTLTGQNGITIVIDRTTNVALGATAFFPAHVASPGAYGNMPAQAFSLAVKILDGYIVYVTFTNPAPFTGGQNGGSYTFVQQNDITAGEQTLEPMAKQYALNMLNAKISTAEQWVQMPLCTTTITTDGIPKEQMQSFHITMAATCSGEAYNTQEVEAVAARNLAMMVNDELGDAYQLFGKITTTITGVQMLNKQQGTLAVSARAEGQWMYHFTHAQKQQFAQIIDGKSSEDARKLLLQQPSIKRATIIITHGFWLWNRVPTDLKKISIAILPAT